jgi:hypothetical protein
MMVTVLSVSFIPAKLNANPIVTSTSVAASNASDAKEANALIARLNEIKSMDMSKLSFSEKRSLRKEVRTIKVRLADIGGGVYISVGALILIIILLIILL